MRRRPLVKPANLDDPVACLAFEQWLSQPPVIPWQVNAHLHNYLLDSWFQAGVASSFPLQEQQHCPSWISSDTWQYMATRKRFISAIKKVKIARAFALQSLVMGSWAEICPLAAYSCEAVQLTHHTEVLASRTSLVIGRLSHAASTFQAIVKRSLKVDKANLVDAASHKVKDVARQKDSKMPVAALSPLRAVSKRKNWYSAPPAVRGEDGELACTPKQARMCWQNHFAKIEAGHVCSMADLFQEAVVFQKNLSVSHLDLNHVPSLHPLERDFAAVSLSKAVGESLVPGDIFARWPNLCAAAVHPLTTKVFLRLEEPITHKGGMLKDIYKGKGPMSSCSSSRGIMLEDVVPKVHHKAVRRAIQPHYEHFAPQSQCAAVDHRGTDMAAQHVREFQKFAKRTQLSAAILFVDVQNAFYTVLRELVTELPTSDDDVARLICAVGLPPEAMHELANYLAQPSLLEQAGVDEHLQALVADTFSATWFSTEGLDQVVATKRGTRPGDPLADQLFGFVIAKVQHRIHDLLAQEGLLVSLPLPADNTLTVASGNTCDLADVTYVDDTGFFASDKSPVYLLEKLEKVTQIVINVFMQHLLVPNIRRSSMLEAFRPLAGPVLSKSYIPCASRMIFVHSLMLTRLWFNAEIWPQISQRNVASLESAQHTVLACVACMRSTQEVHWTRAQVLDELQFPALHWSLLYKRLCYLSRFLRHAPPQLRALAFTNCTDPTSWTSLVCHDIARVYCVLGDQPGLPNPSDDMQPWLSLAKDFPQQWKAIVRKTVDRLVQGARERHGLDRWRAAMNALTGGHVDAQVQDHDFTLICSFCHKEFDSPQKLALHEIQHGKKHVARSYAIGTQCQSCCWEFHSRPRLIRHLAYARTGCLANYKQWCHPLNDDDSKALDAEDAAANKKLKRVGETVLLAKLPAFRATGPSLFHRSVTNLDASCHADDTSHLESVHPSQTVQQVANTAMVLTATDESTDSDLELVEVISSSSECPTIDSESPSLFDWRNESDVASIVCDGDDQSHLYMSSRVESHHADQANKFYQEEADASESCYVEHRLNDNLSTDYYTLGEIDEKGSSCTFQVSAHSSHQELSGVCQANGTHSNAINLQESLVESHNSGTEANDDSVPGGSSLCPGVSTILGCHGVSPGMLMEAGVLDS